MPAEATDRTDGFESLELTAPGKTEREIVTFVRDVVDDAGADGVVVCLDGERRRNRRVDVTVEAIHRHDVFGSFLAANQDVHSGDVSGRRETLTEAQSVAEPLGIAHRVLDVQPIVDRFVESVSVDRVGLPPTPTDWVLSEDPGVTP